MISSTWSQIAQPEKSNPILSSPMTALTSSPLIRNSSVPTSTSGLFKTQLSFQSSPNAADSSTSSSSSDLTQKLRDKSAVSPNNETVDKVNVSTEKLFRLESNSSTTSNVDKIG
jgi:hypothetical protein